MVPRIQDTLLEEETGTSENILLKVTIHDVKLLYWNNVWFTYRQPFSEKVPWEVTKSCLVIILVNFIYHYWSTFQSIPTLYFIVRFNSTLCHEIKKWKVLIFSTWNLVNSIKSGTKIFYFEHVQTLCITNLRLPKCFKGDLLKFSKSQD